MTARSEAARRPLQFINKTRLIVIAGTSGTGTRSTGGREGSLIGIQDLLRHRSEAGLDALEVGPLIGRGSFGRVYKGGLSLLSALLWSLPLAICCCVCFHYLKFCRRI